VQVEELLETLVGVVDAELLERVVLEDLETSDIEDTDEVIRNLNLKGLVELLNNPQEHTTVESLAKGFTRGGSLIGVHGGGNQLLTGLDARTQETSLKLGSVDAKELSGVLNGILVGDLRGLAVVDGVEADVTEVEDSSASAEDGILLNIGEVKNLQGLNGALEFLLVVHVANLSTAGLVQELVVIGSLKVKLGANIGGETNQNLVEDVERTLSRTLANDTGTLKEVGDDGSSRDITSLIEGDLDKLTETRRVVVLHGLGVTESLEQRVSLEKLLLELTLLTTTTSNGSKILDNLLGVLSLTGTRLTSDEHGLVLAVSQHGTVGRIGHSENVRGNLITTLADVSADHLVSVDRDSLERVDGNQEKARVCVDDVSLVSQTQVVEHGGLREVRDGSTILNTIELGRVTLKLISLSLGHGDLITAIGVLNLDIVAVLRKDDTGVVVALSIRNPHIGLISSVGELIVVRATILQVSLVVRKFNL